MGTPKENFYFKSQAEFEVYGQASKITLEAGKKGPLLFSLLKTCFCKKKIIEKNSKIQGVPYPGAPLGQGIILVVFFAFW